MSSFPPFAPVQNAPESIFETPKLLLSCSFNGLCTTTAHVVMDLQRFMQDLRSLLASQTASNCETLPMRLRCSGISLRDLVPAYVNSD